MTDPGTTWAVGKLFDKITDGLASAALEAVMRDRLNTARERLVKRMAAGRPWAITEDQGAAALFTYLRAAEEGVARRNLDLMAQALASMAPEPTFAPDEFRRHARVLADLSFDEIKVLASVMRCWRSYKGAGGGPVQGEDSYWDMLKADVCGKAPSFQSVQNLTGILGALQRTGWIVMWPAMGSVTFIPAPSLEIIERLVDFEAELSADED